MTDNQASQASPVTPVFQSGFCDPGARKYILVATILASSLGFIDGSVVAIATPAIRASLAATLEQAQWVHNAYMLTLSALILAGGALGDRFGLARVFGIGIVLFVCASLLCAAAASPGLLISARLVQGIGAAIMVPGSLAIIARAYPRDERGRAIGLWAASAAVSAALGSVVGGLALSLGGPEMWRWIFAINLPMGAIALFFLIRHVRTDYAAPGTPVDFFGAAVATAALFCVAWGLTSGNRGFGATQFTWIFAGLVLLGVFLLIESRSRHPMMPLSLFANRNFAAANLLSFALYSGLSMMFFFLPMLLVSGWRMTELDASFAFAPMTIFMSTLSTRMGRLADRYGAAPLLAMGALIVAAGYAMMAINADTRLFMYGAFWPMCLVGLGMSMVVAPLSTTIMGAVEEGRAGIASGVNNAVTRMAGLMSIAAMGAVATSAYAAAGGSASFGELTEVAGHGDAVSAAFSVVAWVAAGLSALSAVFALGITRQT